MLSPPTAVTYLLAALALAAAGAVVPTGTRSDALSLIAYACIAPWVLAASTETLVTLTVLALPFDTWKVAGILSLPNLFVALTILRILIGALRGTRPLRPSFAYLPLAAMFASATISTVGAEDPAASARLLVSVAGAGAFAVVLLNTLDTPALWYRFLDALALAGIVLGITTVVQVFAFRIGVELWDVSAGLNYIYNLSTNQLRATGIFNAPSSLATYALPGAATGLFLWKHPIQQLRRRLWRLGTISCLVASLLTLTRATLLTLALLLFAFILARTWVKLKANRRRLGLATLLLLTFAFWAAPRVYVFLAAMNPLSTYARLAIYMGALKSVQNNLLFGTGLGSLIQPDWSYAPLYDIATAVGNRDITASFDARSTHSTPLQVSVDMGLCGLLAFGWTILATCRRGLRVAWRRGGDSLAAASLAALLGTVFVLFFNAAFAMKPLWMTLGMTWSIVSEHDNETPKEGAQPSPGTTRS